MGFANPTTTPREPTLRRCQFCGRAIVYISNTKAPGWCHVGFHRGAADWATCSGKSAAIPMAVKA